MPNPESSSRPPSNEAQPGWKLRLEDRLGTLDPITVEVFRSFGTSHTLHLRGRVIERKGVQSVDKEAPTWRNILNTLQRLDSDEIPGAHVRAHFRGERWDAVSDDEGYLNLTLQLSQPLSSGWHEVSIELVDSVGEPAAKFVRERVLVPSPDAEFAVGSDLDDTVVRTRATDFLQEAAIVFSKGARTRIPFPGVPALYRALSRGPDDEGDNPMFYVSKSGWNLYDLMESFLDLHGIPLGPICLSDLRLTEDKSPAIGQDRHKHDTIDLLLRTYPELPFLLIGDSGQHDPELYQEIVHGHPGRIRAIYIHDVASPERDREVLRIKKSLEDQGVALVYAEDTIPIAEHAVQSGYISHHALDAVRQDVGQRSES